MGAEAAAVATRTGCAAQGEFLNVDLVAAEDGAQLALAQFDAFDHRAQRQVAGVDFALPIGFLQSALQGGAGVQGAAHAPAGRGQEGPDTEFGQLGIERAADRCVGRPVQALTQPGAEVGLQLAGARAVPLECGLDGPVIQAQHGLGHADTGVVLGLGEACA